jgi:hypothetical protein
MRAFVLPVSMMFRYSHQTPPGSKGESVMTTGVGDGESDNVSPGALGAGIGYTAVG